MGYARVSTAHQDAGAQKQALRDAGAIRVFTETASGATATRPQLAAAMDYLRPGDVLAVWKLDRLGRSLRDLIVQVEAIQRAGAELRSLTEQIDTTTPAGRLFFHVMAALANFERELIRERTMVGLAYAASQGRRPGRPTVMTPERIATARTLRQQGRSLDYIAKTLGVGRGAVTRALEAGSDEGSEG